MTDGPAPKPRSQRSNPTTRRGKGATVAAVLATPLGIALWLATRPPATPAEAASDIFDALQRGESGRIARLLLPEEQKTLGLTDHQIERVMVQVVIPTFKKLSVRTQEGRPLPGAYETYFMAPCGPKAGGGQFTLGIYGYSPGMYRTSLTNLYIGLEMAESRIAKTSGREGEVAARQRERVARLSALGMRGLYNADDRSLQPW